jgi:hypothetical protein
MTYLVEDPGSKFIPGYRCRVTSDEGYGNASTGAKGEVCSNQCVSNQYRNGNRRFEVPQTDYWITDY